MSKASKSKQKCRGQLGMMMPFFGLLEVAAATMPMVNTKRKGKGLILASTICLDTDLPYSPTDKEGTYHFLSFFWSSRFGQIPNFYRNFFLELRLPYTCPFWPRKLSPTSGRQAGLKTERSALSSVSWLSTRFEKLKEFRILSSVAQLMSHRSDQMSRKSQVSRIALSMYF